MKNKLFTKKNLSILFIVLLAAALRFWRISETPPSLNWDEVSHGYNAYSLLKTGKDEWGKNFPVIFRAYGDYKLPIYIYLTSISEIILGLTTIAVRLPSILAGIGTVLFTYLLAREMFRDKKIAIISAFLVAVEPWSLFLSRGAFEANLSLFFIVSGMYFFVKGLRNAIYLIYSSILLGLSVWTYNSARVFVPLLIISTIFIYRKELIRLIKTNTKTVYASMFLVLVFMVPMVIQLLNPAGQARYGWVSIIDEGAVNSINESIRLSDLPVPFSRLVHNKATYFISEFTSNYFSHFSVNFLFLKGGSHYQFSIPDQGLLYLINLPFLVFGVFLLLFIIGKKEVKLLLVWILLAPVASSVTSEAPHVLRSIVFLPIPMIVTSVGVVSLLNQLKPSRRQFTTVLYSIIVLSLLASYLNKYFDEYRSKFSWVWQYGYEQTIDYVKVNYDQYDKIIMSKGYGEPHEFLLFYWPWVPNDYLGDKNLIRFFQTDWYWVDAFDKFYFVNDWQINEENTKDYEFYLESKRRIDCLGVKCLLVTSPGNVAEGWDKLETINFLDNKPAFEIYEN